MKWIYKGNRKEMLHTEYTVRNGIYILNIIFTLNVLIKYYDYGVYIKELTFTNVISNFEQFRIIVSFYMLKF